MRVLLSGAKGRLGTEIHTILKEQGVAVEALGRSESARASACLEGQLEPYVFVDVSLPEGTLAWSDAFVSLEEGKRRLCRGLIIGTTGFDPAGLESLQRFEGVIPWMMVSNFSAGIFLFEEILRAKTQSGATVATLARSLGFDLSLWESHHTRKSDSPSGTAKTLAEVAGIEIDRVSSTRVGMVVGEHILFAAGDNEELRIQHIAHTRRLFARGACEIAQRMFREGLLPRRYDKAEILSLPVS